MVFTGFRILLYFIFISYLSSVPHPVSANKEKFIIEGEILFSGKGKIYIYLVIKEIFQTPFTGIQTIVIEPKKEDIGDKKVRFSFHNVERGTYGIRCFQDQDGDGKLNKGMFGPSEPWGMS